MPVRYLLDTNTVSYVIKGNFPQVRAQLLKVAVSEVGISVITEAELRFGVARLPQATKLAIVVEEFLLRVEVLPWDSPAARHYARLRAARAPWFDWTSRASVPERFARSRRSAERSLVSLRPCDARFPDQTQ